MTFAITTGQSLHYTGNKCIKTQAKGPLGKQGSLFFSPMRSIMGVSKLLHTLKQRQRQTYLMVFQISKECFEQELRRRQPGIALPCSCHGKHTPLLSVSCSQPQPCSVLQADERERERERANWLNLGRRLTRDGWGSGTPGFGPQDAALPINACAQGFLKHCRLLIKMSIICEEVTLSNPAVSGWRARSGGTTNQSGVNNATRRAGLR